jgi:hypothetical protein
MSLRSEPHPRPGRPGRTSRGSLTGSQPKSPQPPPAALCSQQHLVLMVRSDSKEIAHGWTPAIKGSDPQYPGSRLARTAGATSVASKLVPQHSMTKPRHPSHPGADTYSYRVPLVTEDVAASWTAEGAEITATDATLDELTITPSKLPPSPSSAANSLTTPRRRPRKRSATPSSETSREKWTRHCSPRQPRTAPAVYPASAA